MPTTTVNGIRLFYEIAGQGAPLVLVHGSWGSHDGWGLVVPRLARSFRVLVYDRRGHSRSERRAEQGSVLEDVADLAALIEHHRMSPAWVAGSSFGASITLRLAAQQPDLLRGIMVHEPPLFALLAGDSTQGPALQETRVRIDEVVARIAAGDHAGAAEHFVERVALGPGTWAGLPPALQQTFVENATTFLDEANDPDQLAFDLQWLRGFVRPVLLSRGDQSPPLFSPVVARLAAALPHADVLTFTGAGHIPHATHPDAYVDAVLNFTRKHAA